MPERHLAGIALGSNLPSVFGSPKQNLLTAYARIAELGRATALSTFYATEPEIYTEQPPFLNAAMLLETTLEPQKLLRALLEVEQAMGRVRVGVPPKGPRIIDLDLLFMDGMVLSTAELTLPHLALAERGFVLLPLAEIAADWVHPVSGLTVRTMLEALPAGRLASVEEGG